LLECALLAYDASPPSRKALHFAKELAKKTGSELLVLYVIDIKKLNEVLGNLDVEKLKVLERRANSLVEDAVKYLNEEGVKARGLVKKGPPPEAIVETAAEEGCSMIIVGSRGLKGLKRALLGSVSDKVLRISNVPVLIVKG